MRGANPSASREQEVPAPVTEPAEADVGTDDIEIYDEELEEEEPEDDGEVTEAQPA